MLVWTNITVKEYVALKFYGELAMYDISKSSTVAYYRDGVAELSPSILKAYRWMSGKLREKDSNDFDLEFPRWVWYRYGNVEGRDLVDKLIADGGICQNSMLCLFDLNPNNVLLSDHSDWHCPLNDFYCSIDEDWDENWDLKFSPTEEEKIKSWDRVFDVDNKSYVQGVVWKLLFKDLLEARFYRAR